jgi:ribokinase
MHRRRLLCVGQLTVDTVAQLDKPLARNDQGTASITRSMGGTAAIVAHNAAVLDRCDVVFAGHVGMDAGARNSLIELTEAGVNVGALVETDASPEVIVVVEPNGDRTMIAAPGAPDWALLELEVGESDIVFFEGWHLFADDPEAFSTLIRRAAATGATIAIDVCSAARALDPLRHAHRIRALVPDIILCNDSEDVAYGLSRLGTSSLVVVHAGPRATHVYRGTVERRFDVTPRTVVDTTGAGDTFAAGLLSALADGDDLATAVQCAHAVAGDAVEIIGALLPVFSTDVPRFHVVAIAS